jgi:hypothetical protein
MTELLPSQQRLRDRIVKITEDPEAFRSRTFLIIGEAGTGKTVLAKELAQLIGFHYCNLADEAWTPELFDTGESLDYLAKLIRERSARERNLLLDGITPLYLMHGLDWCRRLITTVSELTTRKFAFLVVTIGDLPGSPHPLHDDVERWFKDSERILPLTLTYDDTRDYCIRKGMVPVSGANLYELQVTT